MPTQPVQNKILLDNDTHMNRYIWEFSQFLVVKYTKNLRLKMQLRVFPVLGNEIHLKPGIDLGKPFSQFFPTIPGKN